MPYLIDGHNLIAKLPDLFLDDPDDEARLVNKLRGFTARTGKRLHVIFDYGLPAGKSSMSTSMVTVTFASQISNADELLIAHIRREKDPKGWIVVSSDERVLACALQAGMRGLRCQEFARLLNQTNPQPDAGEWVHAYVKAEEVAEFMDLFAQHNPTIEQSKPIPLPVAPSEELMNRPTLDDPEARTVPKPKPKPTPTKPPKPPKRPKPLFEIDEKDLPRNDIDYWLGVFGEDKG
jgi:uncharacterized protein